MDHTHPVQQRAITGYEHSKTRQVLFVSAMPEQDDPEARVSHKAMEGVASSSNVRAGTLEWSGVGRTLDVMIGLAEDGYGVVRADVRHGHQQFGTEPEHDPTGDTGYHFASVGEHDEVCLTNCQISAAVPSYTCEYCTLWMLLVHRQHHFSSAPPSSSHCWGTHRSSETRCSQPRTPSSPALRPSTTSYPLGTAHYTLVSLSRPLSSPSGFAWGSNVKL